MRLLDKMIIKEFISPFIFGVALFTSLMLAATYLFGLTDFFVKGVPLVMVLQLTFLYLPGLMSWTFPMASLLAVLLGFGRLSNDSEMIAIFASGVHFIRILLPTLIAGLLFAGLQMLFNEQIVPRTSIEAQQLKAKMQKSIGKSTKAIQIVNIRNDTLFDTVVASEADLKTKTMYKVNYTRYNSLTGMAEFYAYAEKAVYADNRWIYYNASLRRLSPELKETLRIDTGRGEGSLIDNIRINKTPEQIATDMVPAENLSRSQILERIYNKLQAGEDTLALQIEYYNKYAVPFASVVFCLLSAVIGIRDPRKGGAALGYVSAVGIILLYYLIMKFLTVLGSGGRLEPWLASFTPNLIGIAVAGVLLWKRSR